MTINRNLANLASAVVSTGGDLATANLSGTITNSQLAGSITSDKISSITSSHVTTALGFTPGTGSVTSVATGNGLSGGTITGSGTLVIAAPSYNSVGSYCNGVLTSSSASGNTNYAAGTGANQMQGYNIDACGNTSKTNNFSGTWKAMCGSSGVGSNSPGGTLFVRVS